jgi:hypothetical protein
MSYPQNRSAAADEYAHSHVETGGLPHHRHPRETPGEAAHGLSSTDETLAGETLGRRDDDDRY